MHIKKFINFKNIFFLCFFMKYSFAAIAANYYMACYYYDTNRGENSHNPSLMKASTLIPGAITNYFWAIDLNNSSYVQLNGKIVDGFYYAEDLNYETAKEQCQKAITQGTFFWKSNKSYKLYDIKASRSNYDGFEYPIRFKKDDSTKGNIKQIVLFGDSLSDSGNLKRWTKVMPFYPFWYGRFSDGFIWNDYLKKLAHLPILNFSFGGAKTEGNNNFYIKDFMDYIISFGRNIVTGSSRDYINNYVNNYLTNDSYINKSYYISNPEETLFILWIGANDYISTFEQTMYSEDFFKYPDSINGSRTVSKRAVDNIISQIKTLSDRGGRHFLVLNLPDFGKTPLTLDMKFDKNLDDKTDKQEFSVNISNVISFYNQYLKIKLDNMENNPYQNLNISLLDVNKNFNSLLDGKDIFTNQDFNYGFTKLDSIYPIPGETKKFIQDYCYKGSYLTASKNSIKGDKSAYQSAYNNSCKAKDGTVDRFAIFWNSPHPTSYTHCWISYMVIHKLEEENFIPKTDYNMENIREYCQRQINI